MVLIYLFSYFLSLFSFFSTAQPVERWLVEVRNSNFACIREWRSTTGLKEEYLFKKLPVDGWYVMEIPASQSNALRALPCVSRMYEDQRIDWRDTEPNDPAFINQSDMKLIGMPKAWDYTTGGVTVEGDTIVAAIIDEGFESNHPDLVANLFYNKLEIPDDGIDNDQNGYKDDYLGYNVKLENDAHPVSTHGTSVAGVVGATGNNNMGVSGVNWKVKLLLISGADFESELIESYQYVLDMRNLYEETGGEKGAFVVVTNLSAGINNAFAVDHPIWCEMYDKLGDKGILSVCAAPNSPISVDVDGDMPTTCTSEFMIAVTNVDKTDQIVENAGYGINSIDIGAPGTGTVTTASGMTYKPFDGTSSATPHVTGTIALLYSTSCVSFLDGLHTHPSDVARRARDLIFATAKPNNSLDGITVTGKRLDSYAVIREASEVCNPHTETAVQISYINPSLDDQGFVEVGFTATGDTANAFMKLYAFSGEEIAKFSLGQAEFLEKKVRIVTTSLPQGAYVVTLWNGKLKSSEKFFVAR
ncbi:MAG TPA: S8 family serine peptidase [Saprospiraceae bacterium]|nr:S8 family serine peptidase [Saprospiraceae bacterium]